MHKMVLQRFLNDHDASFLQMNDASFFHDVSQMQLILTDTNKYNIVIVHQKLHNTFTIITNNYNINQTYHCKYFFQVVTAYVLSREMRIVIRYCIYLT